METSYKVIYTGEVHADFNLIKVEEGFAKLFKITPEKASTYLTPNKVIKKDLTQARANTYKRQLEKIGMLIKVECEQPEFSFEGIEVEGVEEEQEDYTSYQKTKPTSEDNFATSFEGLSVVGLEDHFTPSSPIEQQSNLSPDQIECPKCLMVQNHTQQCASCGIYIQKVLDKMEQDKEDEETQLPYQQFIKPEDLDVVEDETEQTGFVGLPYTVGAVVAFLGALIWNYIAIITNYEIGWVAVIIGVAIGTSVSFYNKAQRDLSIVCVVLTLSSIIGGKYLIAEDEKEYIVSDLVDMYEYMPLAERKERYASLKEDASKFLDVLRDDVRFKELVSQLSNSYGYYYVDQMNSEYTIKYVQSALIPYLEVIESDPPTFEQWNSEVPVFIESLVVNVSAFAIIKMYFGWIDWLFLFFGVSAAYKICKEKYV